MGWRSRLFRVCVSIRSVFVASDFGVEEKIYVYTKSLNASRAVFSTYTNDMI